MITPVATFQNGETLIQNALYVQNGEGASSVKNSFMMVNHDQHNHAWGNDRMCASGHIATCGSILLLMD